MTTFSQLRIWNDNGKIFVARDKWIRGTPHPEHLVIHKSEVHWMRHKQGGICEPLLEIPADRHKSL